MAAVVDDAVMQRDRVSLALRYRGGAVDDGLMDVYDAANNMVAFSNFVVSAAKTTFGKDVEVKADVTGFTKGSFETDLLFHIAGVGSALWAATPSFESLLSVMKESLALFRFLGGKEPKEVERIDDRSVNVTNNSGQITVVNIESLTLTLDDRAGKQVGVFVGEALGKLGVESIEISTPAETIAKADARDREYYRQIVSETPATTNNVRMSLTVETPNFKNTEKWRFFDGASSFLAGIEDKQFVRRIENGEPFRMGDIMDCVVRIEQTKVSGSLRLTRTIVEVLAHRSGLADQGDLPLGIPDP